VTFYDTAKEAEKAGYRPCRRCKPDRMLENEIDPLKLKIAHAVQLVHKSIESGQKVRLADLALEVGMSKWHLQRVFKRIVGVSPNEMTVAGTEANSAALEKGRGPTSDLSITTSNSSKASPLPSLSSPGLVDGETSCSASEPGFTDSVDQVWLVADDTYLPQLADQVLAWNASNQSTSEPGALPKGYDHTSLTTQGEADQTFGSGELRFPASTETSSSFFPLGRDNGEAPDMLMGLDETWLTGLADDANMSLRELFPELFS